MKKTQSKISNKKRFKLNRVKEYLNIAVGFWISKSTPVSASTHAKSLDPKAINIKQ